MGVYERRSREKNIIIYGLKEKDTDAESIHKLLNEKVQATLNVLDINYIQKL